MPMDRAMQRATCQRWAGPLFNRLLRRGRSWREMKVEASDSYQRFGNEVGVKARFKKRFASKWTRVVAGARRYSPAAGCSHVGGSEHEITTENR